MGSETFLLLVENSGKILSNFSSDSFPLAINGKLITWLGLKIDGRLNINKNLRKFPFCFVKIVKLFFAWGKFRKNLSNFIENSANNNFNNKTKKFTYPTFRTLPKDS